MKTGEVSAENHHLKGRRTRTQTKVQVCNPSADLRHSKGPNPGQAKTHNRARARRRQCPGFTGSKNTGENMKLETRWLAGEQRTTDKHKVNREEDTGEVNQDE